MPVPVHGLSVIVITRDEEKDIEACLQSVNGLSTDIVVVDSGSTDRTLDIVRRFTSHVVHKDWVGFSQQKQFALDRAKGPWVLNIDADERVSEELQQEIRQMVGRSDAAPGYRIPFHHYFMGRRLKFGGNQNETHVRLFQKAKATYGSEKVHEGIQVDGNVASLSHPVEHTSYRDISDYLKKCNWYTSLIAEQKYLKGARFHWWHHLRLPYEFFMRYLIKLGFLDGEAGLTYALLSSYYVWMKFLKLRDMENK